MQSEIIDSVFAWLNNNQGVVSVLIFVFALLFGWASGIFSSLRRRPRLRLGLIEGPTFCCTFMTGKKENNYDVHRTGIALYLHIANVGSSPTNIESVSVGYHWHLRPFSMNWLRYRVRWFWLHNQTVALEDFHVKIGDKIKVYPFLIQGNVMSPAYVETYLAIGQSVHGVVYFEQTDSWGGCFPAPRRGQTRIIVSVVDTFGTNHRKRFWIPVVTPDEATKYNPRFGDTFPTLKRGPTSDAS